ncbi:MAG: hypothetical protein MUQ26_05045 [Armatimonadetes bacterium]|nr:hypothetical protein [Armatimonadota bacterium]
MHNVRDQHNRLASHERPCRLPVLDQTRHDPAVVAISEYLLYIGRRPERNASAPAVSK